MHEIPDCLNRRYKALDDLVKELGSASDVNFDDEECGVSYNDPGVRLMCDFWNILKENPDCNLTRAVQSRMDVSSKRSMFQPHRVSCYMAAHNCTKKDGDSNKTGSGSKPINECCHRGAADPKVKPKCCASKSVSSSHDSNDVLPLSKVLCNLKEAASFDRKCQGMVNDLMAAQKELQDQIQHLEHREKEGIQLLKQADCMWSCMEDAYKSKIFESQERQQELIKQLKEAEGNANKWRKSKKDLEFQMENVNTCHQEISEKLHQKQNDLKCMNRDIADYKKRIENNMKELEASKKSIVTKKHTSDDKIKKISGDISKKEAMIREETAHKEHKENEGNQYIREARADLLNLSKVLLQKKIENEEMKTEKETLIDELDILSQSYDQCKDRCKFKKQSIEDEIKRIDNEIANYKAKCVRCHQCTDTIDIRKCCTDCPRCLEERECLYKEDHCSPDHTMDCVCMSVKQKFLDNVFENMYTVLERQIKTGPGKCIAETVLNCLKKSRNGKLDQETRQILQEFILTTVKKNLNLTIVGGAVKTRCELDPETYKQLMLCLKQVKAVRPPKADKQTAAKKPPCPRWGGESECNCPKGPKACVCTKRAPAPPTEPGPCPPPDKEDKGEEKVCPYKESAACGPDCAMHAVPSAVGTDVAAWRPDPCQGPTCMFKNMRAAQCVLGPEALNTMYDSRSFVTAVPHSPNSTLLKDQPPYQRDSSPVKLSPSTDTKQMQLDTINQCNDKICGTLRSDLYVDELVGPFIKSQKVENNIVINTDNLVQTSGKIKPSQTHNIEKLTVDNQIKVDLIKEQFNPILNTKSIQNKADFFKIDSKELLETNNAKPSDGSKMEIDDKIIELIENITKEDPSSFISLKKTNSGHVILGFNSVSDDGQFVVIKRSPSGNMIIEIDANTIHDPVTRKVKQESPVKIENVDFNGSKTCKPQCSIKKQKLQNNDQKPSLNNYKENFSICKSKRELLPEGYLNKLYENGHRNIGVMFKMKHKEQIKMQGVLTQMTPESVAIFVKKADFVDDNKISFPVLLQKSESGAVTISIDDNSSSNGFATRTASNGFLVYLKQKDMEQANPSQPSMSDTENVFKIKIKGLDVDIKEPPAVIKRTPSGNFDVVMEKEFEKYFTQTIQHDFVDENETVFDLTKTSSSVILDFDNDNNLKSQSQKALLMKSNSGLLKIIVSDATQSKNDEIIKRNKPLTFGSMISAKGLRDLLGKLPSNAKLHKNNSNKIDTNKTKSSSDSHLYEAAKMNLHSNQSLLENSATSLKKTPSGQYAVVLDKESKKSFINNLLTYLDKSTKGGIPIKITDSGEIMIVCDKNTEIGECKSLKITSSGNIYFILDEDIVKQMYNNVAVSTSFSTNNTDISPYVSKIEYAEDKAIATNCKANPNDSLCDTSKCFCARLNGDSNNSIMVSQNTSLKVCGKRKCSRLCDEQSFKSNNRKSPHIVIRQYESRTQPDKCSKFKESYYCEVESVCQYHKDRYKAVSNELLEISGLCNKVADKELSKKPTYTRIEQVTANNNSNYQWDSFEYLPHQLPDFLKNIESKNL